MKKIFNILATTLITAASLIFRFFLVRVKDDKITIEIAQQLTERSNDTQETQEAGNPAIALNNDQLAIKTESKES